MEIEQLYAWVTVADDGTEEIGYVRTLNGGRKVLMFTTEEAAMVEHGTAALVAVALGRPVRLVRFERSTVLEELTPERPV